MNSPELTFRRPTPGGSSPAPASAAPATADAPVPGDLPVQELQSRLLRHYDLHRRDLPWRKETDPYRIWVSEVMLQQTRVETVIPYYRRWMERFPDLEALASSEEDEVLVAWEGLGYYARARNLHRAARVVRDRHAGGLPRELADLRTLPGFGSYTAGAVASIAFGVRAPAVDGNVRRVLSRLLDLPAPSAAELSRHADGLVHPERPGDFNQALMELGATLCTPRSPRCGACPLRPLCLAAARGTVHERPARRPRAPVPERSFVVLVLLARGGRTLLVRRPRRGLLGGLWAFPERELLERGSGSEAMSEVVRELALVERPTSVVRASKAEPVALPEVRHLFTHFRARYLPWLVALQEPTGPGAPMTDNGRPGPSPPPVDEPDRRWVRVSEPGLALPTAQKRIMASLNDWLVTRISTPPDPDA